MIITPSTPRAREFARIAASGVPRVNLNRCGDPQDPLAVADERFEQRTPFGERALPDVFAAAFEHVVGHEDDGHGTRHLGDLLLTSDPLLQRGKRQRAAVTKREHFAVQHRAVGQVGRGGGDLGKSVCDQFLPARPEVDRVSAANELRADAVPLPLDLPVAGEPSAATFPSSGAARQNG